MNEDDFLPPKTFSDGVSRFPILSGADDADMMLQKLGDPSSQEMLKYATMNSSYNALLLDMAQQANSTKSKLGTKDRFHTEIAEPQHFEPLIFNPTINQQIRNRKINRNDRGLPVIKQPFKSFKPVNPAESKKAIKNDVFTLFDNEYDLAREKKK